MIRPIQWRLRPRFPGIPSREAPRAVVLVPDAGDRNVVHEVLESIRRQRDVPFEAVALAEPDHARRTLAVADAGGTITFVPIGRTHGLPALYNLMLADTRAEFLFTLPPGAAFATEHGLARMIEALDAEPTAALALTAASSRSRAASGTPALPRPRIGTPPRASSGRRTSPPDLCISLLRGSHTPRVGVLVRSAMIRELGGLDPRFPTTGERLLWLRLLLAYDAVRVPGSVLTPLTSAASAPYISTTHGPGSEELAMLHELDSLAPPDPRVRRAIERAIERWMRRRTHVGPERSWGRPRVTSPTRLRAPRVLVQDSGNG